MHTKTLWQRLTMKILWEYVITLILRTSTKRVWALLLSFLFFFFFVVIPVNVVLRHLCFSLACLLLFFSLSLFLFWVGVCSLFPCNYVLGLALSREGSALGQGCCSLCNSDFEHNSNAFPSFCYMFDIASGIPQPVTQPQKLDIRMLLNCSSHPDVMRTIWVMWVAWLEQQHNGSAVHLPFSALKQSFVLNCRPHCLHVIMIQLEHKVWVDVEMLVLQLVHKLCSAGKVIMGILRAHNQEVKTLFFMLALWAATRPGQENGNVCAL